MGNRQIENITVGPRQSNFELLRIVAMFLVLIIHAAFWATGTPSLEDYAIAPIPSATRAFFECISMICVNIFVAISGWFSIKTSMRGAVNFLFQCIFLTTAIYITLILCGEQHITLRGIRQCLLLTDDLWFCHAYLALYICAPILNSFCEHATKKQFGNVLLTFFCFQTIFGITDAAKFVIYGYSYFSLMGIYLLARFIRIYKADYTERAIRRFIIGGFVALFFNFVIYIIPRLMGIEPTGLFFQFTTPSYINPCVIWGSISMLLLFARLKLRTLKWLNWISASTFAVYIIHISPFIGQQYFKPLMLNIYDRTSGIVCLAEIFICLVAIFFVCVLIDQPRKFLWSKLTRILHFI